MTYLFNKWLNDECTILRMIDNTIPGNPPKATYEPITGVFKCRYVKKNASIAETLIGGVPVTRHILFLFPDTEIKENYRVQVNGKEFTVKEVLPIKRLKKIHHLEVNMTARN